MKIELYLLRIKKIFAALGSLKLIRALFSYRVLVGAEHQQLLKKDFATILDVGANRGQFALAASHWCRKARIISFEPLKAPAEIFRKVFQDDSSIELHEVALGVQKETRFIHISAHDDSSSLLPISSLQSKLFPGTEEISTEEVQVAPLNDYISEQDIVSPSLLKIDVQGFEFEVLQGCKSLLEKIDLIYCECSFVELYSGQRSVADIIEFLASRNFVIIGIYNLSYDKEGQSVQADFLFERKL